MNISNLIEGQTIKNYKELCSIMEWKVSAGNTKKRQIKDLERYCKYHKEGNKFIIDEVFDIPLPKEDKRINNKGGNNSTYIDYIEKLIVHMLSTCPIDKETKTINMSKNGLYLKLHMINKNYNLARNNINRFSRYLEVPTTCVYDFYNNTSGKLNKNIERALNRLQSQCLIHWEYRIEVRLRTGEFRRLATDKEINNIITAERKALFQLNKKDKREVFLGGKWNDFNDIVCKELQETTNINYYYKVIHVNTTDDFRKMLLEVGDLEEIQNELNASIYFSAIETATTHHKNIQDKYRVTSLKNGIYYNKPIFENEQVAIRPEYIEDTKKIASQVIDWDTYTLDLRNISSEKYTLLEALVTANGDDWGLFLDDALDDLF